MGHSSATIARMPPAVRPGDRVGVAALSGRVDPLALDRGVEALWELGFEPVVAENVLRRHGTFAGSDDQRLAGFEALAADPGIRAIFFARGGHGVLRLLERLDWALLERLPRAYVGYSDLTPFLLEIVRRLGVAAFHGPMVAVDLARGLDDEERARLLGALGGESLAPLAVETVADRGVPRVEGPLVGGCLSMLAATLGTEFGPRPSHSILFWEDVSEPLYRLDRLVQQLRLAGGLEGLRAMVVGKIEISDGDSDLTDLPGWLEELAERLQVPLATGCASGHCEPNMTLPLGGWSRLDLERGELTFGPSEEAERTA